MKKIIYLLLSLLLISCSTDNDATDPEIPQVEMYSEEGLRLLKQYAEEVNGIIEKHKQAYYSNKNRLFSIRKG